MWPKIYLDSHSLLLYLIWRKLMSHCVNESSHEHRFMYRWYSCSGADEAEVQHSVQVSITITPEQCAVKGHHCLTSAWTPVQCRLREKIYTLLLLIKEEEKTASIIKSTCFSKYGLIKKKMCRLLLQHADMLNCARLLFCVFNSASSKSLFILSVMCESADTVWF